MSNQGLSIFDHEPEDSGDAAEEPTQVIPRVNEPKSGATAAGKGPADEGARPSGQKTVPGPSARAGQKASRPVLPPEPAQETPVRPATFRAANLNGVRIQET